MFSIILARPENAENIGLVARAMKNTGFKDLRLTAVRRLGTKAHKTGIHAEDILASVRLFPSLQDAVADLDVVFAATARPRKNFPAMALGEAVTKMAAFPSRTRIGLLFGNERTGLTSDEMRRSNFRFNIPQAARQPSYNLGAAVLLTLFHIFARTDSPAVEARPRPLSRREQDEFLELLIRTLSNKGFVHKTNRRHVAEMIYDLFGRLTMTAKDRNLLLAIFYKGADGRTFPARMSKVRKTQRSEPGHVF